MAYFGPLFPDSVPWMDQLLQDQVEAFTLVLQNQVYGYMNRIAWLRELKHAVDNDETRYGRKTVRDYQRAQKRMWCMLPYIEMEDVAEAADDLDMDPIVLMSKLYPNYVPPSSELTSEEKRELLKPWPEGLREAEKLALIHTAIGP